MKINSFKRNKKGQAFSTFQLLIAAVVALALLGVLMSIIGNVNPVNDKVIDALKTNIKSQQNNPGSLSYTREIKISRNEDVFIDSETIVEGSGLYKTQAIFYKNQDSMFDVIGAKPDSNIGYVLEVKAPSSIKYRFGVLCNSGLSDLNTSINRYHTIIKGFNHTELNEIISNDPDYQNFYEGFERESTVCLVFPMRAG